MATKRRGGLHPPELRGTLGTLLRTTTGVFRDALERGAREGRARLDAVRTNSRRHDALADLGELVLDLIRRGEIDLAELPEARTLVRQLDELDLEATDDPDPAHVRPSSRSRFDDRPSRPTDDRHAPDDRRSPAARPNRPTPAERPSHPSFAAERPSHPDLPERPSSRSLHDDPPSRPPHRPGAERPSRPTYATSNDGTVSSGASPLRPTAPSKRAESHDPATSDPPWDTDADSDDSAPSPSARRSQPPHDPFRKGGISFDDDDLHEYMHPDDVPAKPASDPDDGEP